ncbi:hypothetical protein JVU11DRAFT_12064 [Chiua virens]|nr:hypothetical protein JVU11DRAFT_12064 [Chiua virens]
MLSGSSPAMIHSRLLPIRRLVLTQDDHLELLCRRMNVGKTMLPPGAAIPSTIDLPVLKDAHSYIPSHVLAVFDIPQSDWEPSYSPILVPIHAGLHARDFRTRIIPQNATGTRPTISRISSQSGGHFVTLPVVPLHVPHAPSIPLLFLFALGLESRSQLLCCRLLPTEVISEFPALPTMAQLMGNVCSDRQLTDYIVFNQGLWKNILHLGPRDAGFVGIARTAWNVTVEARRNRQRAAAAGVSTNVGNPRHASASPVPNT